MQTVSNLLDGPAPAQTVDDLLGGETKFTPAPPYQGDAGPGTSGGNFQALSGKYGAAEAARMLAGEPGGSPLAPIGTLMSASGRYLKDYLGALAFEAIGDPEDQLRQLSPELKAAGVPVPEVTDPIGEGIQALPRAARIPSLAVYGTAEIAPKLAAVAGAQALGVPAPVAAGGVFGLDDQGNFDPKQAALAAALPMVGKMGGNIAQRLALATGMGSKEAMLATKVLGNQAAANTYLGVVQASEIANLPPDKRADAWVNAIAGDIGQSLLALHPDAFKLPEPDLANMLRAKVSQPGQPAEEGAIIPEDNGPRTLAEVSAAAKAEAVTPKAPVSPKIEPKETVETLLSGKEPVTNVTNVTTEAPRQPQQPGPNYVWNPADPLDEGLPTQTTTVKGEANAVNQIEQQSSVQPEREAGNAGGQAAEASGGNRLQRATGSEAGPLPPSAGSPQGGAQPVSVVYGMAGAPQGSFKGNIKTARDWALQNLRGTVVNKGTGIPIQIARTGILKALSESAAQKSPNLVDHVDAMQAVPHLLAEAQLAESRPALKKTQDIGTILRFHAPLRVNGNDYTARMTVREHIHPKGHRFYTYELMELEKQKPAGNSMDESQSERAIADSGPTPAGTSTSETPKGSAPRGPKTGGSSKVTPPAEKVNKPAEQPAQAAAKVEKQVKTVARTEGQRPAKEVKSELVRRVEEEIAKLPPKQEFLYTDPRLDKGYREFHVFTPDKSIRVRVRETSGGHGGWTIETEKTGGKTGMIERKHVASAGGDISSARVAAETALEKLQNPKLGSVTIEIPGDGKFTIARTHAALGELLARAKALDTRPTVKTPYRKMASDTFQPGELSFTEEEWQDPATITKLQAAIDNPKTTVENRRVYLSALEQAKKLQGVPEETGPRRTEGVSGFGGSPRPRKVAATPPAPGTAPPPVNALRQWVGNQTAGTKSLLAPATLGNEARYVGNALRHFMGQNALAEARADHAMQQWRKEFARTPVPDHWVYDANQPLPHNYAVIDALERDRAQLPPGYQALANVFEKEFAWRIAEIQKYSPNALQHLIQYYFPHVWEDPKRAANVMAQIATRLFAGRREFLKKRSLAFFTEGLAAGLKPVSDNPVDLLLAKMHSMDKFLLALRATNEFRATGAMKFKYLFDPMPEGWSIVDDPAFIVQRPPVVTLVEATDAYQRAKLGDLLKLLGVSYKRVASLGGNRWAEADYGMKEVRAKVGATEDILWHEAGHHIDNQFPALRNALDFRGNSPVANELRALVDLNHPGTPHNPNKNYHRYLRKTEEKIAEMFRAYVHAPDLFQKTAPNVSKVLTDFLNTQPAIRDLLNEMRNGRMEIGHEETEMRLGGMQQLGHWIMPTPAAQVIKNHLSPGLSRFWPYRSFRAASNILNGAQLGISGFHIGFTSLDAMVSRLAVAIEDAAHGKLGRAAKTAATVPVSFITNAIQGHQIRKEALNPGSTNAETAALVRALEHAGGRIGQDAFWKTHFTQRTMRYLRLARQSLNDADVLHAGKAGGIAALNAPLALIEQTMRPVMEFIVPRQKLGVFADMARREIERLGPNASVEDTREAMRKAWDSVDNRMGQVVYDNQFYNRALKDMLLLTFRAWGWQQGKYAELLGAGVDAAKFIGTRGKSGFTHRMAYVPALVGLVALLGALVTRWMTGRNPKGKDYFMPPTGETDMRGNPARLNFPSYMKDVMAYQRHPVESLAHSLNPAYSEIFDLMQNKDFYDVEIRHPDDPLWKQGEQLAAFAAKQFVPFSISGAAKMHEQGSPLQKEVLPFFGITPAPSRMTMTPAQELATDLMAQGMGDAPRTQEQFDKSKMIRELVKQIKAAPADRSQILQDARQSGKLDPQAAQSLMERLKYNPLQFQVFHFGANDAMKVWRVANTNEQAQLEPLLVQKVINSKTLSMSAKTNYLRELTHPAH